MHMDGARLWGCEPFYGRTLAEIAGLFDTVYVSLYKQLGGIAGCCLAGPEDVVAEVRGGAATRRHALRAVALRGVRLEGLRTRLRGYPRTRSTRSRSPRRWERFPASRSFPTRRTLR